MERIVFDAEVDERIIVETDICNVVVESKAGVVDVQVIGFNNIVEYVGDLNHRIVVCHSTQMGG